MKRLMQTGFALAAIVVCAMTAVACGQDDSKKTETVAPAAAPASAPAAATNSKEHVFHGKIEQIDAGAQTLTVNGENVEGWMAPMTMMYHSDKPDIFKTAKVGDAITAKVYDGDFQTLHDIRIDVPAPK